MPRSIFRDVTRAQVGAVVTQPQVAENDGNPWYCPRERSAQREYSGIFPNSRVSKHKPAYVPKPREIRRSLQTQEMLDDMAEFQSLLRAVSPNTPMTVETAPLPDKLLTRNSRGYDPEQSAKRDRQRHEEFLAQRRAENAAKRQAKTQAQFEAFAVAMAEAFGER